MRQVTLRGLLALAIVLGVTFIPGTLVLTDTLHNTFSTLFTSVYSKIDFQVRGVAQFGSGSGATRDPPPESLLARVRSVPGVGGTYGEVQGYAQFIARDGKPISSTVGVLGVAWDTDPRISSVILRMTSGSAAALGRGEMLIDATTAARDHLAAGDVVPVRFAYTGPVTIRIGGIYSPTP